MELEINIKTIKSHMSDEGKMFGLFVHFLKDKDAWRQYCQNVTNSNISWKLLDVFWIHKPSNWINMAFTYSQTPEGMRFWRFISHEWQKEIKKHYGESIILYWI